MIYKPFPDNDITKDDKLYIREIQEQLRALELAKTGSSSVPVDGIYDPMTTEAVEKFQKQQGLPVTGIVDRTTYYKIVEQYNALMGNQLFTVPIEAFSPQDGYIMRPQDTGDSCAFLNIMLRSISELFRNVPCPTMDENYSKSTEASIRAMQSSLGLPATGLTNRKTWNGITSLYNDLVKDQKGRLDTRD